MIATQSSSLAGTRLAAPCRAQVRARAATRVQATFWKTGSKAATAVTNKDSKKTKALTAGVDINATQFTADFGVTKKTIALGFTKSNELFVGRAAMLGVAFAIVGELLTGVGPLQQLGYELHESVFDVEWEIIFVALFNLAAASVASGSLLLPLLASRPRPIL